MTDKFLDNILYPGSYWCSGGADVDMWPDFNILHSFCLEKRVLIERSVSPMLIKPRSMKVLLNDNAKYLSLADGRKQIEIALEVVG